MSQPALTVLVVGEGRHLFDDIHAPGVHVTTEASTEPQLIVFPVSPLPALREPRPAGAAPV